MTRSSEILTSGQAASLAGVSQAKLNSWIDSEALPGYRIPETKHRRVHRADLVLFMSARGMFRVLGRFAFNGGLRDPVIYQATVIDAWGEVLIAWSGRVSGKGLLDITEATDGLMSILRSAGYTVLDRRS